MDEIYGPEDIEQLLLRKDFSELYPEEREYVLKHMEDEAEYNAMRLMLLDFSSDSSTTAPPPGLKSDLVAKHVQHHQKGGIKIWLNSLFSALVPDLEWRRPALQLAGIAAVVVAVVLIVRTIDPGTTPELAQAPMKEKQDTPVMEEMDANGSVVLDEQAETESPLEEEKALWELSQEEPNLPGDLSSSKLDDLSKADQVFDIEEEAETKLESIEEDAEEQDDRVLAEKFSADKKVEDLHNQEIQPVETTAAKEAAPASDTELLDIVYSDDLDELSQRSNSATTVAPAAVAEELEIAAFGEAQVVREISIVPSALISSLYTAW